MTDLAEPSVQPVHPVRTGTEPDGPAPWWEDGRRPGAVVVALAAVVMAVVVVIDLALTGRLSQFGDLCFVVVCLGAALAVRPTDAYQVALSPPLLMLLVTAVLGQVRPGAVAEADDGLAQAVVSGLTHHSAALAAGFVLCLVVLVARWSAYRPRPMTPESLPRAQRA